jgi:hypothetical protein
MMGIGFSKKPVRSGAARAYQHVDDCEQKGSSEISLTPPVISDIRAGRHKLCH